MRKSAAHLAVALVSFVCGLASVRLVSLPIQTVRTSPRAASTVIPNHKKAEAVVTRPSPPSDKANESITLNGICSPDDSLSYAGFKVARSYNPETERSTVIVKRGRRVLARHDKGEGLGGIESSCFGLLPVLGRDTKQLVMVQYSGGAHCCFSYWIYDLQPEFRLIFDGAKYPIGDGFDELEFKDIDGDGVQEFTQKVMTFDYWEDMAYVSSPQPDVVFQYDPKAKRYYPSNGKFVAYLLKGIKEEINNLDRSDPYQHWVDELRITLRYIYAGKEKQGWEFFDKEYGLKPHEKNETKTKIKEALKGDSTYRFIYQH